MSYSTQINADTPEDVVALAEVISIPITVRINPLDIAFPKLVRYTYFSSLLPFA
jgi:hypothetical protein